MLPRCRWPPPSAPTCPGQTNAVQHNPYQSSTSSNDVADKAPSPLSGIGSALLAKVGAYAAGKFVAPLLVFGLGWLLYHGFGIANGLSPGGQYGMRPGGAWPLVLLMELIPLCIAALACGRVLVRHTRQSVLLRALPIATLSAMLMFSTLNDTPPSTTLLFVLSDLAVMALGCRWGIASAKRTSAP